VRARRRRAPRVPHAPTPSARVAGTYEGSIKNAVHTVGRVCVRARGKEPTERYLEISPPQSSPCYCDVTAAAVHLLTLCGSPCQPGAAQALRRLQSAKSFAPCVQRLMELVSRWDETGAISVQCLPSLALRALAYLCGSAAAPRVRWLLRGHKFWERRWDKEAGVWRPPQPDDDPSVGFAAVVFRGMMGELGDSEDTRNARVLVAVLQGEASATKRDGVRMLPPLPAVPDDVEEAFDALTSDALEDAISDELGACADEAERKLAMLFFLDATYLPPGTLVGLHGLAGKPELNGAIGVVGPRRPAKADAPLRYPVRLADGDVEGETTADAFLRAPMGVRPRNLRLVPDEERQRLRCSGKRFSSVF